MKRYVSSFKKFSFSDSGMAAIEAALVFPFMLFMLFGLVDITDMVSTNRKITAVSSTMADLVGQNRTFVTRTSINDYFKVVKMIMEPIAESEVTVRLYGFRRPASGTSVSKIWTVKNGKGPGCSHEPDSTKMLSLMQPGTDLVVSQTCYISHPVVGAVLISDVWSSSFRDVLRLEQTITQTPRSTKTLDCKEANEITACPISEPL